MRAQLRAKNASPKASQRGPGRGIAVKDLHSFLEMCSDYVKNRNMHYVNGNFVLPITEPEGLSYVDLIGACPLNYFTSHSWGNGFRDFVLSIKKHAESTCKESWQDTAYWICTFSNNQWDLKSELGVNLFTSSFYLALKSESCSGTAMVIDSLALPLTRVWCLFEVVATIKRTDSDPSFGGLMLCTPSGVLNQGTANMNTAIKIAQRCSRLDMRNAEASCEDDKQKIHALVEAMEGGFSGVNRFVRTAIRNALFEMHTAFERDFDQICYTLKSSSSQLCSMLMEMNSVSTVHILSDRDEDNELQTFKTSSYQDLMRSETLIKINL